MGEYARYGKDLVKMGTCENLYYLRHEQRCLVSRAEHSLDVNDPATAAACRFRFPFPDEDAIEPGAFEPYSRGLVIAGATIPSDVEHHSVTFRADGYAVGLPCPESADAPPKVARSHHGGVVELVAQKPTEDGTTLRAIFRCRGCGAMWRADTWEEASDAAYALMASTDEFNRETARRLAAGYGIELNKDLQ